MKRLLLILALLLAVAAGAQTTAKVIDSNSGETIPYANIRIGTDNLLSNAEGFFSIPESTPGAAFIAVSYMGYAPVETTLDALRSSGLSIRLTPQMFELDEVKVAERPTPAAIMEAVKRYLKDNHQHKPTLTRNLVFLRETDLIAPKQVDIEITKSAEYAKGKLKEINRDIEKFTRTIAERPSREYADHLFEMYRGPEGSAAVGKIKMLKATKLRDASRAVSLDDMQEKGTSILLRHLDTTKYYRIKSGWFGSRDTISFSKKHNQKKKKTSQLESVKNGMVQFLNENNPLHPDLDFLHNTEIYKYQYEGAVFVNDNEFAYVLSFWPDSRKAKYKGKLFISESDFGVLRAEYALAEGKKVGGFNMRLLLGIKASENVSSGTMIFKRREAGGYQLQYASREEGQYVYLNRPLKLIEMGPEDKVAIALDLKFEGDIRNKTEFLDISNESLAKETFDGVKETDFKYQTLTRYDPSLWKDYSGIEPLQEMKRFDAASAVN